MHSVSKSNVLRADFYILFFKLALYETLLRVLSSSTQVYDEEFGTKDVFCGMWSDLTWQSKGNRVKVIFASNQKGGPGFLASYRFVAPW